jgi:DNA adenine methylase Dam
MAIGFAQQTASVRMPMLVQPPFNYTGSKYRLLPQLMPMFDYSRHTLVDLFIGGGSVWCNLVPYFERAIANDIIRNLVEAQQALLDGDAIIAETKALCVAKDDKPGYHRLRDDYNVAPTAAKYFALSLCCNNNMARFNASFKFNQTFGRRTWNSSTTEKVSHYTAHTRVYRSRVRLVPSDFARVAIPDNSMVYVDPPYSNTEAGYNTYWRKDDVRRLFEHLLRLMDRGHAIAVSGVIRHNGKECPLLNLLIDAGWQTHLLCSDYSAVSKVGPKDSQEVLLTNYDPPGMMPTECCQESTEAVPA